MKTKNIVIILLFTTVSVGSYYFYQYNYVKTLMLSEIIGETDNSAINLAVNLFDFDTELTRHDISKLRENKDYWISRIKEVDLIEDSNLKTQSSTQLFSDMMKDPVLKKICSEILNMGTNVSFGLIESIL